MAEEEEVGAGTDTEERIYLKGWQLARLAYYDEESGGYLPIGCITSRSESNSAEKKERVSVCTQGETETAINRIVRTVSIEGEAMNTNSLNELRALQSLKEPLHWKTYWTNDDEVGSGDDGGDDTENNTPVYFTGVISDLSGNYNAGEDATFSMTIDINGDYSDSDPSETEGGSGGNGGGNDGAQT